MRQSLSLNHAVELTFHFEVGFTPETPAKMPNASDEVGDPGSPEEWEIEKLTDVTFFHRRWSKEKQGFVYMDVSLIQYMRPEIGKTVLSALADAIQASELNDEFGEAVAEEASE